MSEKGKGKGKGKDKQKKGKGKGKGGKGKEFEADYIAAAAGTPWAECVRTSKRRFTKAELSKRKTDRGAPKNN